MIQRTLSFMANYNLLESIPPYDYNYFMFLQKLNTEDYHMKTNIFLHGENQFAFSFKKSDINSVFDKKAICKLVRTMFLTNCIHYDFDTEDLDHALTVINFNHIAFTVENQDLYFFPPTE